MNIFGISLTKIKKTELLGKIFSFNERAIIFTPNPEILLFSKRDGEFTSYLQKAQYLLPDGIGIYLASQILDSKKNIFLDIFFLPIYVCKLFFARENLYENYGDKICGSDLTLDILRQAEKTGEKIIILDLYNPTDRNKVENQRIFQEELLKKFPRLVFDFFIWKEEEKDKIIQEINNSSGKIVFSTLGMKKQEKNIIDIMESCPHVKVGLGVGSSFDYITGMQKRAPIVFQKMGTEWFYRLVTGPKKIKRLQRLWNAIFVFIYYVYKEKYFGNKG